MEILNNCQLAKRSRRVFHYRVKDDSSPNAENPAKIDGYSIVGNDLILTHKNHDDPKFEATDTFRDWRLLNVDKNDCDPGKLSRLTDDVGIKEIKILEIRKGRKLIFSGLFEMYTFTCEEIEQEIRGYSRKEIVDKLLEIEEAFDYTDTQHSQLDKFVTRLSRFVSGNLKDHKTLFEMHRDKNIPLATRSAHYLEILTQLKDKFDDLKQELQVDWPDLPGKLI